jgi:ligand-binding sensor domain-containing protein
MMHRREWLAVIRVPVLLGFLVLMVSPTFAGGSWRIFDQSSGLPGDNVLAFAAAEGKMAVGTENGVGLYDGASGIWSKLVIPGVLATTTVRDLVFDQHGNLWCSTPGGLVCFQKKSVEVYGIADGLPTIDTERLQIRENDLFVGLFGGLICRADSPEQGRTSFDPVNFSRLRSGESLEIQTIGITGFAMRGGSEGWFSTRGGGMILSTGLSRYRIDRNAGLASDWVEAFWMFRGNRDAEHILVGTTGGVDLVRDMQVLDTIRIPVISESTWVTSLTTTRPPEEEPWMGANATWTLDHFLGGRSLWVGTRSEGLLRFENGGWTKYDPDTSKLPSKVVNRLYFHKGRIIVCTNRGLTVIPLASNAYDEFRILGYGKPVAKTFLPWIEPNAVIAMSRKTDLWVATADGIARLVLPQGGQNDLLSANPDLSSSREAREPEQEPAWEGNSLDFSGVDPDTLMKELGGEIRWERFNRKKNGLPFQVATSVLCDDHGATWFIFERKLLARVTISSRSKKAKEENRRHERYRWEFFTSDVVPWKGERKLTALWWHEGRLFVGTKGDGFYILVNPQGKPEPDGTLSQQWIHHGPEQGLFDETVIGFTAWKQPGNESRVAILHHEGITLWDGIQFSDLSLGFRRKYTCIAGDPDGNLWIGSESGGVFRVRPTGKIDNFTRTNGGFGSNHITAIVCPPSEAAGGASVWVGCDESDEGQDQMPSRSPAGAISIASSTTTASTTAPATVSTTSSATVSTASASASASASVEAPVWLETEIDGASLNAFDGLTWDTWKIPGVRCLMTDGDFLWIGTNLRLRRLYVPIFLGD